MSTVVIPLNSNYRSLNDIVIIDPATEYLYQNTSVYTLHIVVADTLPDNGQTGLFLASNDRMKLKTGQNVYAKVSSTQGLGYVCVFDTVAIADLELLDNNNEPMLDNIPNPILLNF